MDDDRLRFWRSMPVLRVAEVIALLAMPLVLVLRRPRAAPAGGHAAAAIERAADSSRTTHAASVSDRTPRRSTSSSDSPGAYSQTM